MKRLLALLIIALVIFTGCSRISGTKGTDNSSGKINTPSGTKSSQGEKQSSELQRETEELAGEIDELLDSLEDIDESEFDF